MLYQHYTKGVISQLAIGQGPFVIIIIIIIITIIIIFIIMMHMKRFSSGGCYANITPKERAIANGQRSFMPFLLLQLSNSFLRILAVPNKAVFCNSIIIIIITIIILLLYGLLSSI